MSASNGVRWATTAGVVGVSLLWAVAAYAQRGDDNNQPFTDADYSPVKPEVDVATAKIGDKPAWCDKVVIAESWAPGRIGRSVNERYGVDGIVHGALHICQRPTDATWRTEAGYILQKWMNATHQSQAEAEASLRMRVQEQKWSDERAALCKALQAPPEAAGSIVSLAKVQWRFFGCDKSGPASAELWVTREDATEPIGYYIDSGTVDHEIARMYWLMQHVPSPWEHSLPSNNADENRGLLQFAIAEWDFEHFDKAALRKLLAAPPYNDFARTVVQETLDYLDAEHTAYEAATDKLAKSDKVYQHILRELPKDTRAAWDKSALQWKAELERSSAFERSLAGPSLSAAKGCAPALKKDVDKLVKSFKLATYDEAVQKITSDPVANILLRRLAVCYAIEGITGASGALQQLVDHNRDLRGPRSAVHYALLEAIVNAKKDRPRLLLSTTNYMFGDEVPDLAEGAPKPSGSMPEKDFQGARGIVKSVTKGPFGFEIKFKTEKVSFPAVDCRDDTSHPLRVNSDGRIAYYQICHGTGKMDTQDLTPDPFYLPTLLGDGIAPGTYIVVDENGGLAKGTSNMIGFVLYSKSSAKDAKIKTFMGFVL